MRRLYSLALYLLVPWIVLRLLLRAWRNPAYLRRWPERFGFIDRLVAAPRIWLHAVSVGETRAAVPLVSALQQAYPDHRVLITTMTPTGSDQVRQQFGERVEHCYVPYDLPDAVWRFFDRAHPRLAIIMETEFWPNLFHACAQRNVPVVVANMRMSEKSMRGYLRLPRFMRQTLANVTAFGAQSQADAERLARLGAPDDAVAVTGNVKFDMQLPASVSEAAQTLRRDWGRERPVFIAASTRDGEEEKILAALPGLKQRLPGLLLVIVPRHPERFAAVAKLCRAEGYTLALRSEGANRPLDPAVDVYLGDSMGELLLMYAAADVAFVGGSLLPLGGQNPLEACALGVPVVFGPHMFNFAEVSRLIRERGAGREVANPAELEAAVTAYLADPNLRFEDGERGRRLIAENRGAVDKTLALVARIYPRRA